MHVPSQFVTNCQSLHSKARVLFGLTWTIARLVIEILNLVVKQCVLN
jgi:hypothetical protein